jgi:hypothetical protein
MVTALRQDICEAATILGDMLTNCLFRDQDLEIERYYIYNKLLEKRKSMPFAYTIDLI